MSNTGFTISDGRDLIKVFKSYTSTKATATGFKVGASDLCDLFEKYVTGNPSAVKTNFVTASGDLSTIFAKYVPYAITGSGIYTSTSGTINSVSYNTILTFTSGTNSITITQPTTFTIYYLAVGPGGNGYKFAGGAQSVGGGGGGGEVLTGSLTDGTYNISIGSAGSNTTIGSITARFGQTLNSYSGATSGSNNTGATGSFTSGGGGGGSAAAATTNDGGAGTSFNGVTYGVGGKGGTTTTGNAANGANNTGNGGGGANHYSVTTYQAGTGGSGIVIIYFNY